VLRADIALCVAESVAIQLLLPPSRLTANVCCVERCWSSYDALAALYLRALPPLIYCAPFAHRYFSSLHLSLLRMCSVAFCCTGLIKKVHPLRSHTAVFKGRTYSCFPLRRVLVAVGYVLKGKVHNRAPVSPQSCERTALLHFTRPKREDFWDTICMKAV